MYNCFTSDIYLLLEKYKSRSIDNMRKSILTLLIFIITTIYSYGQNPIKIIILEFKDKYSEYVKKIETGQNDIDYQDFRFSFIDSEQFKIANRKSTELANLEKEMYTQMDKSNFAEIINITKQMLSINYTNMLAHKILRQTYKIIGDTENEAKYKTIQFGLLNSIIKNGDGKTCSTAWPVIRIDEEYFILQMLDAKLHEQTIDNKDGLCDKLENKRWQSKDILF
jgi:hypothetical protein